MDSTIEIVVKATTEQAKAELAAMSAAARQMGSVVQDLSSPIGQINSELATQTSILEGIRNSMAEMSSSAQRAAESEAEAGNETVSFGAKLREMASEAKEATTQLLELGSAAKLGQGASVSLAGGIGAVGAVLGGGIVVRELAEMLNRTKENAIEMEHLSLATGQTIPELVGLTQAMVEQGATAGNINLVISKLSSSMQEARDPSSKQAEAFKELGVSTAGWAKELPPLLSVLESVATHLHNSTQALQDNANMREVAGRNTIQLTAFLKESGDQLKANVDAHKEYGDAVEHSSEAALQLQRSEAKAAEQWNILSANALPEVIIGVQHLIDGWIRLRATIEDAAGYSTAAIVTMGEALAGSGKIMSGVASLDLVRMTDGLMQLKDISRTASDQFKAAALGSQQTWTEAYKQLRDLWKQPMHMPAPTGDTDTPYSKKDSKAKKVQAEEISAWEAHNLELVALQRRGVEESLKAEQIGLDEALSLITKSINDELTIREDAIQRKIALYSGDPDSGAEVAKLEGERTAAMDKAAKEQQAILFKASEDLARSNKTLKQLGDSITRALAEEGEKSFAVIQKQIEKEAEAREEYAMKRADSHKKALNDLAIAEIEHNIRMLDLDKEMALARARMAGASASTQIAIIRDFDARIQTLQNRITALKIDAVDKNAPDSESQVADIKVGAQKSADQSGIQQSKQVDQVLTEAEHRWQSAMAKINSGFDQFVRNVQTGNKSIQQSFAQLGEGLVTDMEGNLLRMGVKFVETELRMLIVHATTNEQKVASDAAAATQSGAISAAAALKQIIHSAASAAAKAYESLAGIPIVGPALGAGAAAATFAGVMAFESLISAEHGAVVGNGETMAMLHPREMVLPANLSEGFQKMLSDGGSHADAFRQQIGSPAGENIAAMLQPHALTLPGNSGAGAGGGDTFHTTVQYHAYGDQTPEQIMRNKGTVIKVVQEAVRSGRLQYQS